MASRTYAAAIYFNLFKYIPSGWNWVAAKHEVLLPPVFDSAALRTTDTPDQSDSQLALEDARPGRSTPIPPPPASYSFAAKATSAQSARKSAGSSKIAAPRESLPLFREILVGWGFEAYA